MRPVLIIILIAMSFSASAQWYRIDLKLKKKQELPHPQAIEQLMDHSISRLPKVAKPANPKIFPVNFSPSDYSYEAAEAVVMRQAQHNMRFRVYAEASYNFSELAHLYLRQNRFSEAKWFLLQSNILSREQNDDKHTIANLLELATIKVIIGEYVLAQADLTEAHDLAGARGFKDDQAEIENMMAYIKQNKLPTSTPVLRYAETPQDNTKAE